MPVIYGVLDKSCFFDPGGLFGGLAGPGRIGGKMTVLRAAYTRITADAKDSGVAPGRGGIVFFHDRRTGLYHRSFAVRIYNELVGVAISLGWNATTGRYLEDSLPAVGSTLVAVGQDAIVGPLNASVFLGTPKGQAHDEPPICFEGDTWIDTTRGPVRAGDLASGDLVLTQDRGPQPVILSGLHLLGPSDLARDPSVRPIRISVGAIGEGLPRRPLLVAPGHRLLVRSRIAERMFGNAEVLVAATQLLALPGISVADDVASVAYAHITCARHEVIFAQGAPIETLYLGEEEAQSGPGSVAQLLQSPARPLVSGRRADLLAHCHLGNRVPLHAAF